MSVHIQYLNEQEQWDFMNPVDDQCIIAALRAYKSGGTQKLVRLQNERVADIALMIQRNTRTGYERSIRLFVRGYTLQESEVWEYVDDSENWQVSEDLSYAIHAHKMLGGIPASFVLHTATYGLSYKVHASRQTNVYTGTMRQIRRRTLEYDDDDDDDGVGAEDEDDDAPPEFVCPITNCIMRRPVLAEDGHHYERKAIVRWFHKKKTSPMTNMQIGTTLKYDQKLHDQIEAYRKSWVRSV